MTQSLMNCNDERQLGIQLAKAAGAAETQAAFADNNCVPKKILQTAVAERLHTDGLETFVSHILQGPPRWAYLALRYLPDLGSQRDALLDKAAKEPQSAFYTLRYVPEVGSHRAALLKKVAADPGWAQMALRHVSHIGDHREALLAAVAAPPVEVGGGWNTYYVNQTGQAIWIMYNTGEAGSTGSLSDPIQILKGQNIGYGRGGGCITETRVYKTEPTKDTWGQNVAVSWTLPFGDNACSNWGFVIVADATGKFTIPETQSWLSGAGMPGKYPPSSGG